MQTSISQQIAQELSVHARQIDATIALLDQGNTVPFIARYRKEVTGGLDDTQLRTLASRLTYLREFHDRRAVIIASITEQGKMTDALAKAIAMASSKTELEDLYLPYKPKRRTKGQMAIEAGLQPLADALWQNPALDPEQEAQAYLNAELGFADSKAALDGARAIVMEQLAEDASLIAKLRRYLEQNAQLKASVVEGAEQSGAKFKDYFEHQEAWHSVPSHRALAMLRGRNENVLTLNLVVDFDSERHPCEQMILEHCEMRLAGQPADRWRAQVVTFAWRVKLFTHLETELMSRLRDQAEAGAIDVFADNLGDLLMAAPAGLKTTMGLDPGLRTGVKVAVVDGTGKLLATDTIYPHQPQKQLAQSAKTIAALLERYQVELIAIGNGTASRETDAFVAQLLKNSGHKAQKVMVSEAGASVYSASELAAKEFPNLDVSLRGAVSIARRLQDPLAELVKIEPKAIGVGQYQHDVSQSQLAQRLDAVIEDCVNKVGVDVNSASAALLTRVAGLNATIASNIVAYRDENGTFNSRSTLKKVPRLGPKAFEQCAGFLRVMQGKNPLDASAVHPEAYSVVTAIADKTQLDVGALIGNSSVLKALNADDYTSEAFGRPTVLDIISELDKPGRDPRPAFTTAQFDDAVHEITDLKLNMVLEGVVTNVTHFGAFVDIGVHQDGLVHISALSDTFVKDPREVVKTGQIVKVKVMEVDVPRRRIALSMRMGDEAGQAPEKTAPSARSESGRSDRERRVANPQGQRSHQSRAPSSSPLQGAFADAFAKANQRKR
ncbi:Protein YhgF [Vibrio stylophorae]|uniref:Protein YhgF n=1 Tax=Vibrio stylophorae TaxID=659351 RepID=A0ABM8ZWC6_9VIBR|nr:Tex family protein [Vibrio stylophorae]CAH0534650.1 Protein YhgF [Vibrio stylophorae]